MKAVRLLILLGLLLVPFIVCADLGQKAVRGVVEVSVCTSTHVRCS